MVQRWQLPDFQGQVVKAEAPTPAPAWRGGGAFVLELGGLRVSGTSLRALRGPGHTSGCNRGSESSAKKGDAVGG